MDEHLLQTLDEIGLNIQEVADYLRGLERKSLRNPKDSNALLKLAEAIGLLENLKVRVRSTQ
jgi:hypothetical protein